jgi:hypothetical protein
LRNVEDVHVFACTWQQILHLSSDWEVLSTLDWHTYLGLLVENMNRKTSLQRLHCGIQTARAGSCNNQVN